MIVFDFAPVKKLCNGLILPVKKDKYMIIKLLNGNSRRGGQTSINLGVISLNSLIIIFILFIAFEFG